MEEIGRDVALAILERGEVAHIAVVDADGPYVSPVSYAVVDDHFVFVTRRGRRFRAIQKDARVSIEVSEITSVGWRSVMVEGDAKVVTGEQIHTAALQALLRKYQEGEASLLGTSRSPGPDLSEVIAIPLDRVTGRSSGEGTHPRTRHGRL